MSEMYDIFKSSEEKEAKQQEMEQAQEQEQANQNLKKKDLELAKEFWETLQYVPVRNDCIMEKWHIFEKGTPINEIWEWFENEFNVSLIYDFIIPEEPAIGKLIELFENNN